MVNLFFSYSHEDEELRDELEKHLSALKHQGLVSIWHDRRIVPGECFDQEISVNLESADIILFLLSSDFLASDYCFNIEMNRALERHNNGEATVIPVVLRPCDWKDLPIGKILATPTDGKPVTRHADADEAFLDIVRALKRTITEKHQDRLESSPDNDNIDTSPDNRGRQQNPSIVGLPRSSNLRVKKEFTDYDKNRFLSESFEYIANFFRGSLEELDERNSHVQIEFRRIDANTFTAEIYNHGSETAFCKISLSDGSSTFIHGILYSSDKSSRNSCNEALSTNDDGYNLFLQQMGINLFHGNRDEKLTKEGAAELYWSLFIEPLQ